MRRLITATACLATIVLSPTVMALEEESRCNDYDVFVLRHLEKADDGSRDPSLNSVGKKNARTLAELPIIEEASHSFYTPYKRTYETLEFIETEKSVYDPKQTEKLVHKIKQQHCGETVLVVGHSNTVPGIIKALGGSFDITYAGQKLSSEPVIMLNEKDYGSVFRVTFHNERIHQQLYRINSKNDEIRKKR